MKKLAQVRTVVVTPSWITLAAVVWLAAVEVQANLLRAAIPKVINGAISSED